MLQFIQNFLFTTIRISTPLIYVAICSTISQQAGLMNMAAESMMLVASLTGVVVSAIFQNAWIGILAGALSSVIIILFLCFASFVMKVDLYLMSISLNMALNGATVFALFLLTGTKATSAGAIPSLTLGNLDIPLIKDIPVIGPIISGHNIFTYMALIMTVIVWFLLFKTKLGLRMRAVGQNPQAVESVGINPRKLYTLAFVIAGFVGSFGGMYLSMGYQSFFVRNITAGRGFVGMAAASIANAMPFGALLMSFVFGLAYATANQLNIIISNSYLLQSLPFLLVTVVYLIISWYRSKEEERRQRARRKKLEEIREEGE
jgi:simple sugar transport system permease protein